MPTVRNCGWTAIALGMAAAALVPMNAQARNIVISNDDGLTSNIVALYRALKQDGHDVIVSVPCNNQSGMSGAILFARPIGPLKADCRSQAAKAGDPGAGPMTRPGLENDFFYVDGTPVMATMYGIDVAAQKRWGKAPDLVLSGPNEGQNVGALVATSGTIGNVQFAGTRGLPAIAFSAGMDTVDDTGLANPKSAEIGRRGAELVRHLDRKSRGGAFWLPAAILNVNFPDTLDGAKWQASRGGTYNVVQLGFSDNVARTASPEMIARAREHGVTIAELPGISTTMNKVEPRKDQMSDETVVIRKNIAVSPMRAGFDGDAGQQAAVSKMLKGIETR